MEVKFECPDCGGNCDEVLQYLLGVLAERVYAPTGANRVDRAIAQATMVVDQVTTGGEA